jgi:putative dimethyl sulfoxide reductase chaperone
MSQTNPISRENRRSDCYRLLAACFYPPEQDQLLEEKICLDLAAALNGLYPEATAGRDAMFMHQQLTETAGMELRIDHAALFVGPYKLKAPPYGSVYLEKGYGLMGDTTLAAMSCYAENGLELTLREPADHIAVELEFMHYLSFLSSAALAEADQEETTRLAQRQQRFLAEHLGAWAPIFCVAVKNGAKTLYFKALADCLQAFLEAEIRQMNEALASV